MAGILSTRGEENNAVLDIPWKSVPLSTYDKDNNPAGLISFANSENVGVQQKLADYVKHNVTITSEDFLYDSTEGGGHIFPDAMASHLNDHFHPFKPVKSDQIVVANSVTAVENILAMNIGDPGDGVLTAGPIYGGFELDFWSMARLKLVYADLKKVDSFDERIVSAYEDALNNAANEGVRIRALLIANPNNPLGQCYPRSTLHALLKFCNSHKIHLISDEIYALSAFDTGSPDVVPFTSVLSFDTAGLIDPDFVQVFYGLSKDFGTAGIRLGCLVTRSKALHRACQSLTPFHGAAGPSLKIGTTILNDKAFVRSFLSSAQNQLYQSYQIVTQVVSKAGINYRKGTNVGPFIYLDLSPYLSKPSQGDKTGEYGLAQYLMDKGVFVHPRRENSGVPGWFRLCHGSVQRDVLDEGLNRLTTALAERAKEV